MIYTPFIWPILIAAVINTIIAVYCHNHREVPAARPLEMMMWISAGWGIDYALELSTESLFLKIALMQVRFLFIPFLTYFELSFVLHYLKRTDLIAGWRRGLLLIVPSLTVVLAMTTQYHPLFRSGYYLNQTGPIPILFFSNGIGFQVYLVFCYVLILISLTLLLVVRPEGHTLFRRQRLLLFVGILFPTIFDILFNLGLSPIRGLALASLAMVGSGLIISYALFQYRLLEIAPIARSMVIEEMRSPMLVIDPQGVLVDMNRAAVHLIDVRPDQAVGKSVTVLLARYPSLLAIFRDPTGEIREVEIEGPAGLQVFEVTVERLLAEPGTPLGSLLLMQEVTERKRAEEALRRSEERYRNLADSLPDYVIVHRDGIILYANQATVEMTGVAPQGLIGRHLTDFVAPESRDLVQDTIHRRVLEEIIPTYEAVLLTRTDEKKTAIINATIISFLGEPAFLVVVTDISDRKQAEEALRVVNTKLNLLSSITRHDITNQLMALKGYLELSQESFDEPAQLEDYLAREMRIADTIERQIRFTRDYDDLGMSSPSWQNISGIIHEAVTSLPMRDISIGIDRDDGEVLADPLFEKVFYNLIDNALRYGGERMKTIRVICEETGDGLLIVFEDDGEGIPTVGKVHLFTKGYGRNTGLGLFLSREILSITGITITETGTPGSGARFEIRVPKGAYRFTGEP
jgi:PAS domain S-box-containing protein